MTPDTILRDIRHGLRLWIVGMLAVFLASVVDAAVDNTCIQFMWENCHPVVGREYPTCDLLQWDGWRQRYEYVGEVNLGDYLVTPIPR